MEVIHRDSSMHRSSSVYAPELRLILVGNIGCGKTLTADTLLYESSSPGAAEPLRQCRIRQGVSEGRPLRSVETPRWYWKGDHVDAEVQRETERALSLVAPGPHAFLILVPVGQFTEVEGRIPDELERMFGKGALEHTLVLLTCGDYLLGRDEKRYVRLDEPELWAMVNRCGGRWHVINNRKPQDRKQVATLLEKVESLVQSTGGCYLPSTVQRGAEQRVTERERNLHKTFSLQEDERLHSHHSSLTQSTWIDGIGRDEFGKRTVTRVRSLVEPERVTSQHLSNGLHSAPTETAAVQRKSSSFKLSKEGAILSQMSKMSDVSESQNYSNSIHYRISSTSDPSTPPPSTPSSPSYSSSSSSSSTAPSFISQTSSAIYSSLSSVAPAFSSSSHSSSPVASSPVSSSSSALSSIASSDPSALRLVLLGRAGSGKSAAGNAILGQDEFQLRQASGTGPTTRSCSRGSAGASNKRVLVVDTPDWFWSGSSPDDLKVHLSSCMALCAPGPHAFLLCVPVTFPARSAQHDLATIEEALGPEAIRRRTLVLFTHSDLVKEDVEQYISAKRPEMLNLVEKCGDRYHVLRRGGDRANVEELLEKVEQVVKENGGRHYSREEDVGREKAAHLRRERAEGDVDRALSAALHSLKEEEEVEPDEQSAKAQESASKLGSVLRFVGQKVGEGAKRVPKLLAGGALLGGVLGLFVGGPVGGAVGATAGTVAAEYGRRKYSKPKTE